MIDDVLDFYRDDSNTRMSDELFEAYLRGDDVNCDDGERVSSQDDDEEAEESIQSHYTGTDKASASKFTTSTKDSHKTGKKLKTYEPLRDEGKVYKYEDDPKKYMRIRKKIQNRESARRVRLREKDGASTLQYRFIELQEKTQRLHIENTALRSENSMLKNQVEFMEKLLLQRGVCTSENGSNTGSSENIRRVDTIGGPFTKNIGMLALVCTVLVATYIPESDSGSGTKTPVQQRILAEITTGFHLFSLQSPSNYFLSIFRITAFSLALFYLFCMVVSGVKKVTKPSTEDILQGLLNKKNN